MPIEIADTLKDTCGWSFSSRGLNSLFCNRFYTALILTIIILILIMNIYPCKKGTPAWITFKLGFYVLVASLSIIIVHDGIMHNLYTQRTIKGNDDTFIDELDGANNSAFMKDRAPVVPNVRNGDDVSGGDGMVGDGTCCVRVGGEPSKNDVNGHTTSKEEVFHMFGV